MSEKIRIPDINTQKRAIHPITGQLMPHSISRHLNFGEEICWPDGNNFGQGSLFPPYIRPGDILKMQRTIIVEHRKYKKGLPSKINKCQEAGGAKRVTLKLNQFGIKKIGSFIRQGGSCTVFPEDE